MPDADKNGLTIGLRSPAVSQRGSAGVEDHNSDIFFAAVETTRMPMILTDPNQPDNPIVFANNAFVRMTGYTPEDMIGKNCRFLQGPETDPETVREVREGIANLTDVSVEILNYRKDQTTFWNALFISPVYNRTGELVYFFASQLDVSRRRDTEMALRQAQKMEAVGQLTGGIAHDFNNLLQVIGGYAGSLKRKVAALGDMKILQQVNAISDAAAKAAALTQQLLAFSRKQRLEGRVINLNQVVSSMADIANRTLGGAVEVAYHLDPELWNTRIDPSQAETSLLNIIINARDAMPNGGKITIRTANIPVGSHDTQSFGLPPGRYTAVSVTDTGTGIDPGIIKRVMDPFFTTKEEGKGTGLGLSMVYGFAKQSGGQALIYSEVGHGTTVRLLFPVSADDRTAEDRSRTPMDRGGTERILVVDDRDDVAALAQMMLEDMGYGVEVASNGNDALEKIRTAKPFRMLFSDIIMPGGMNGFMLAREARKLVPGIKVLLATGYADAAIGQADGGDDEFEVLSKPYLQAELARRVRLLLDGPTGVS